MVQPFPAIGTKYQISLQVILNWFEDLKSRVP